MRVGPATVERLRDLLFHPQIHLGQLLLKLSIDSRLCVIRTKIERKIASSETTSVGIHMDMDEFQRPGTAG
jgi:hypothetical protein